jgi:hypothetical protein
LSNRNLIVTFPPSGSTPVAVIDAAEDVWLNLLDVAEVVAQVVAVSGANILAVDGVLGVELYVTDRCGRLATVAFFGPANRIHDEAVVSDRPPSRMVVVVTPPATRYLTPRVTSNLAV